ncbi:hypothetical protein EDF24_2920 [Curtobacterium sp. PhB130]|uniref:squalene cyclase n=1 Tax=Curtobacterium sp. PhB130 TaxID=2485178 RepID=UPI000F4C67E3|nr:squalene cyclase [Curtobacterium sp. PhB130]ROS73913.1 hypothetical protein EDF24_2920 [Curtobacterium sp. PhB130]
MAAEPALVDWLLETDPAVRWQVERDVLRAPEERWRATRATVPTTGFGARLLALQDEDGQWAGGAYFPAQDAGHDVEGDVDDAEGQPWTATTWSLNALRRWGVDAAALAGTAELLARNSRWESNDAPYWNGEDDCCINGFTLANGAWLGADVGGLADWLPAHQLEDGGWNCEWVEGSTRSSFHSTLNVIEGLLAHEELTGGNDALRRSRHRGEEYLLERHLLRRLSTGEPVGPWTAHFTYPFRWVYSALRALDHFRAAALVDGTAPDPRLADAVQLVRDARGADGRWVQDGVHAGRVWFAEDVPPGEASPWLTLIGTRVLDWWDSAQHD